MSEPLKNIRHERFCQMYAGTCWGNSSEAYRQAGYNPKNSRSSEVEGSRLLRNVEVWARIQNLRKENSKFIEMDREEAIAILGDIARAKITDFVKEDGTIKIHGSPHERAVLSVDVEESVKDETLRRITKIKLHNPIAAIERIAKITGMDSVEKKVVDLTTGGEMLQAPMTIIRFASDKDD